MLVFGHVDNMDVETLNLLHYSLVDEKRGVLGPPFPVVHKTPKLLVTF